MLAFVPVSDIPVAKPVATLSPTSITRLAFRNRFTMPEKVAIEMAAIDNPTADAPARQASAGIRAMLKDVDSASFIDVTRPDTRAGVQFLETVGVLAVGRALEILDAPIAESERPLST